MTCGRPAAPVCAERPPIFTIDPASLFFSASRLARAQNQAPSDVQLSRDPGYAQPPGPTLNVFFGDRGVGDFAGASLFDLAATYDIKAFRKLRPYVKFDMRNIFNDKTLGAGIGGFNTTVQPDEAGPVDADGIPVNYIKGPNFGKAIGNTSYVFPREFRIAVGFRFFDVPQNDNAIPRLKDCVSSRMTNHESGSLLDGDDDEAAASAEFDRPQ